MPVVTAGVSRSHSATDCRHGGASGQAGRPGAAGGQDRRRRCWGACSNCQAGTYTATTAQRQDRCGAILPQPQPSTSDAVPEAARESGPMRFESHFKSYFGNVKAFNLKKFKIIAEPVAAMEGGGPAAGGWWQANSLGRPKAGPSLDLNPSNPFQKPLEVQYTLALGLSEEAQCSLGANLNGASRLLLNCPSGRQVSSSH